jgi:hypothetical protein
MDYRIGGYRMTDFTLTDSTGTVYTLSMPNWEGEKRSVNKNVVAMDFWDNTFEVFDKGLNDEPVSLYGIELSTAKIEALDSLMDENKEVTIDGLGDCYDGVYVMTSFTYKTMKGTNQALEWEMELQHVRD